MNSPFGPFENICYMLSTEFSHQKITEAIAECPAELQAQLQAHFKLAKQESDPPCASCPQPCREIEVEEPCPFGLPACYDCGRCE
jgi:hypothetical protein